MSQMPDGATLRRVMLDVIASHDGNLQSNSVLMEIENRLRKDYRSIPEEAILTMFYDLFRTGHLAWGYNLSNPNPPFCHLTTQGRRALEHLSRDPLNPDGYLAHLGKAASLSDITLQYVREALYTYNAGCWRATAVMVGCAAERLVLELRDGIKARLVSVSRTPSLDLSDWKAKRVLNAVESVLAPEIAKMPPALREAFDPYWPAFTHFIRSVRNDAGHPTDLSVVTQDTVHSTLLLFPELAWLSKELETWVAANAFN